VACETRRSASENDPPDAENPECQYIWDARYIDAPVCRDRNLSNGSGGAADGDCVDDDDEHLYYTTDANFNVTALVDASDGSVVERVVYDPYGKPLFLAADWSLQENGDVDSIASNYANDILFTGHRRDAAWGNSCLGAA